MSPRRLLVEWVCVAAVLCAVGVAIAWTGAAGRLDATLYDVAVRLSARPPGPDVVIVAIDERSLERLGRWPWSRAVHARLVERLTEQRVAAIAFDVLFSEPDAGDPFGDLRLAAALRSHGRAILPLHMDAVGGRVRAVLPVAQLAGDVAIGHVNSELDRDGVVRSVFLREGPGAAKHPHLALALLEAAGRAPDALPGERAPHPPAADAWARDYRYGIPFAGPPGSFRAVSYVDVLEGTVAPETLQGRLVLVGATAIGIKDTLPTPYAGHSAGMAGVEIVANVLDGLIGGREVRFASRAGAAWLAVSAALLTMLAFIRLRPRGSLLVAGLAFVSVLAGAVYAPRILDLWVDPAAALAAVALAYPLWSWRRLQGTYEELRVEIDALARETANVAIAHAGGEDQASGIDPVQRRMSALRDAGARMRNLKRFLADALDGMTDAVLVGDADGRVVVANARAGALFGRNAAQDLLGRDMRLLFADWLVPEDFDPLRTGGATSVPLRTPDERTLLWLASACVLDEGVGTIVTLTDVTSFAVADARRREALGFLSHDLRAPLSGILAIVGLEQSRGSAGQEAEVLQRIASAAHHAIAMADNFTAIARAEQAQSHEFDHVDLRALCEEAIDLVHAPAGARGVTVAFACDVDTAWVLGDASLLRRAVVNLLQNAIQYGPPQSRVDVKLEADGGLWQIVVRDRGPGIPPAEVERIFSRVRRGSRADGSNPSGVGLGLALVRVVARVHSGTAQARNAPDGGAELLISLPGARDDEGLDQRR